MLMYQVVDRFIEDGMCTVLRHYHSKHVYLHDKEETRCVIEVEVEL